MTEQRLFVVTAATVAAAWVLVLGGCGTAAADGPATPAEAGPESVAAAAAPVVAKVVFVDQEEACACTRKRIDGTWAALQEALQDHQDLPVERIHGDTQEEQAKVYLDLRPLMVAPGVYFLDADGGLIDQLQGELTATQIAEML